MAARDNPSIPRVLDVTLRDGGYVNGHSWTLDDAISIVCAAVRAGIAGAEIGYFRPQRHAVDGDELPAASCPRRYIEQLCEAAGKDLSIAVMVHRADVHLRDYSTLVEWGVSTVRLPTKVSDTDHAREHVAAIHDAGMQANVNLLRISEPSLPEIASAAAAADAAGADVVYLADSNGSLFPERVTDLVRVVRNETDRALGFHAHDSLSLAFSNTLASIDAGCTHIDASLGGMGKGGGNLHLELIIGYLRSRMDAPVDFSSLPHVTNEVLAPWRNGAIPRCESIVSGLLDLNLEDIAKLRAERETELLTLLDRTP